MARNELMKLMQLDVSGMESLPRSVADADALPGVSREELEALRGWEVHVVLKSAHRITRFELEKKGSRITKHRLSCWARIVSALALASGEGTDVEVGASVHLHMCSASLCGHIPDLQCNEPFRFHGFALDAVVATSAVDLSHYIGRTLTASPSGSP